MPEAQAAGADGPSEEAGSASGGDAQPHFTAHAPRPVQVDVSHAPSPHPLWNRLGRAVWNLVWALLYRPSPVVLHGWRRILLRFFGASIGRGVHPYPTARVWAPWNLEMADYSCISRNVDCYSVGRVSIGPHATVSEYSYLCTASHAYEDPHMPLVTAPITIGRGAWVSADVFVGPGVTIGEGAVVGARSSVFKDVEPWTVVGGNPARLLKRRELKQGP
jgi:putative colanic acid biosynthesis acetyltransferase WcaF